MQTFMLNWEAQIQRIKDGGSKAESSKVKGGRLRQGYFGFWKLSDDAMRYGMWLRLATVAKNGGRV